MDIIITRRHFGTIVNHCRDYYPAEAGGFLGGAENLILGIFPVPNFAFLYFKEKKQFGIGDQDNLRANQFFAEHKMQVMGFYHSHPSANFPQPSPHDISAQSLRSLKIMMIISLAELKETRVATYLLAGQVPIEQNLKVIQEEDINKYLLERDVERAKQQYLSEMKKLDARVEEILRKNL